MPEGKAECNGGFTSGSVLQLSTPINALFLSECSHAGVDITEAVDQRSHGFGARFNVLLSYFPSQNSMFERSLLLKRAFREDR